MSVSPLEQKRRDLKGGDPELYQMIADLEASKALESFGDRISGRAAIDGHAAANAAWAAADARHATYLTRARG